MVSIILALLLSLAISAAATPLVRRMAIAIGAVDHPSARRVHTRQVARLGGIAIVAGFFLPLLALFAANTQVAQMFFAKPRLVAGLTGGALLCSVLGAFDDVVGLSARRKLVVQCVAACIAYFAGFHIEAITIPAIGEIRMGIFDLPVTIFWIVGIVNALNLIDGLDGLAAGVAFFACVTTFVVAALAGNVLVCLLAATLAGSIVGFLVYNFNPATIFMGDSGSMFLGFVLATTSLFGASQKGGTVVAILVPIVALGLPIVDTLLAMVRRVLERRPIFSADRGHIHHRLLDLGLSHRRAVLILYGASVVFTLGALAIYIGRSWQAGAALAGITFLTIGVVRFVGYFNAAMQVRNARSGIDKNAELVRQSLVDVVTKVDAARSSDEVRAHLVRFAGSASLLAIEFVAGAPTEVSWRWSEANAQRVREGAVAGFVVTASTEVRHELKFTIDSERSEVAPQVQILLQVVADVVERHFARAERPRESSRTGRLRPVG